MNVDLKFPMLVPGSMRKTVEEDITKRSTTCSRSDARFRCGARLARRDGPRRQSSPTRIAPARSFSRSTAAWIAASGESPRPLAERGRLVRRFARRAGHDAGLGAAVQRVRDEPHLHSGSVQGHQRAAGLGRDAFVGIGHGGFRSSRPGRPGWVGDRDGSRRRCHIATIRCGSSGAAALSTGPRGGGRRRLTAW